MADTIREFNFDVEFDAVPKYGGLVLVRQKLKQLDPNEFLGGKLSKWIFSTIFVDFCSAFFCNYWRLKHFDISRAKIATYFKIFVIHIDKYVFLI